MADHEQYKEWSTDSGEYLQTELNQRGAAFQNFVIDIQNNGGTLEARIVSGSGNATAYDTCFETLATSYTAIGSDVSSSQDFGSSGIGRLSGANHVIVCDLYAQAASSEQGVVVGQLFNSTGNNVSVDAFLTNRNINGETRTRLELAFRNATTGADFLINTSNLGSGTKLKIPVLGFLWDNLP